MTRAGRAILVVAFLAVGCGNFFPNADNVQLPSGVRDYQLSCGTMAQGECEQRAAKLVEALRQHHPGVRLVSLQLDRDADYTAAYSDGTSESLIVN